MMWRVIHQAWQYGLSLIKVFFVFSLICFLPQFFLYKDKKKHSLPILSTDVSGFTLAIECLSADYIHQYTRKDNPSIALITNGAATTYKGKSSADILLERSIIPSATHMLATNEYAAMSSVLSDCVHHDLILVDVQDTGSDTCVLVQALLDFVRTKTGPSVILLDRPNLFGPKIEGLMYVSDGDVTYGKFPMRTGMTIGEVMHYYINRINKQVPVQVIAMHNYDRSLYTASNIAGQQDYSAVYTSLLCQLLQEVLPLDVGSATEYAKTVVALPQDIEFCTKYWYELQVKLRDLSIESCVCSYYNPIKKDYFTGLQLHINDMYAVDTLQALLVMLQFFKQSGVVLGFSKRFDDLIGSPLVRLYVDGQITHDELKEMINYDLEQFYRQAFNAFMYHPLPQLVFV